MLIPLERKKPGFETEIIRSQQTCHYRFTQAYFVDERTLYAMRLACFTLELVKHVFKAAVELSTVENYPASSKLHAYLLFLVDYKVNTSGK